MLCVAAASFGASPAAAQLRLGDAVEMLAADDPEAIALALEALGDLGPRAVRPLQTRIAEGLPNDLLEIAVVSLVRLERREATPTLRTLTRHRSPAVRAAAITGLARLRAPGAAELCATALGDGDARVRAAGALGLGALGDRTHMDRLFLAFERRVMEAATAIGQLADDEGIDRLFAYVGRHPLDSITPGLVEVFARENVSMDTKVRLIGRLEELVTEGVRTFLEELASLLPPGDLQDTAMDAAGRISG